MVFLGDDTPPSEEGGAPFWALGVAFAAEGVVDDEDEGTSATGGVICAVLVLAAKSNFKAIRKVKDWMGSYSLFGQLNRT